MTLFESMQLPGNTVAIGNHHAAHNPTNLGLVIRVINDTAHDAPVYLR